MMLRLRRAETELNMSLNFAGRMFSFYLMTDASVCDLGELISTMMLLNHMALEKKMLMRSTRYPAKQY
jgi:hypothetical protein